jgi:putative redox protein
MTDSSAPLVPPVAIATLDWTTGLHFDAGPPGGMRLPLDGESKDGVSPVTALLCAAGACAAADVVGILQKKRVALTRCHVEVGGERRADYPRRFVSIWLRFHLSGGGLTETAARQAVDLSVSKYCSVLSSLNPDIPVSTEVIVGG